MSVRLAAAPDQVHRSWVPIDLEAGKHSRSLSRIGSEMSQLPVLQYKQS
jgi:hypothetical protein